MPDPESLLPGWLFMDLSWTKFLFGHAVKPLEGSFWTLYVEVKFYIFAALVFYAFGRRTLLWALFGIAAVEYALSFLQLETGNRLLFVLSRAGEDLGFENWFWFAAGAAFYVHRQTGQAGWFRLALVAILAGASSLGLPHHLPARFGWPDFAGALVVGSGFALSMTSERVQSFLDSRFLQFFGFISYPLYLLHENMLVATLVKIEAWVPRGLYPLAVMAALAPLVWLALVVARVLEPAVRKGLTWALDQVVEGLSALFRGSTKPGPDIR